MNDVYTTLDSPFGLRKDLLEGTICVVEMMEDFEKLIELRETKHKTFLFINANIRELHDLLVKLRRKFPKVKFSDEGKLSMESEGLRVEYEGFVKKSKEVNNLERELSIIKEKLKDVSA